MGKKLFAKDENVELCLLLLRMLLFWILEKCVEKKIGHFYSKSEVFSFC
jgi:hypothetical protein